MNHILHDSSVVYYLNTWQLRKPSSKKLYIDTISAYPCRLALIFLCSGNTREMRDLQNTELSTDICWSIEWVLLMSRRENSNTHRSIRKITKFSLLYTSFWLQNQLYIFRTYIHCTCWNSDKKEQTSTHFPNKVIK